MIFASASGELKTRAEPNLRCRFAVTLNTPPLPFSSSRYSSREQSATSSPNTTIRESRSISSCIQRLMRSTIVPALPESSAPSSVSKSCRSVGSMSGENTFRKAVSGAGCDVSIAMSEAALTSASTSLRKASSCSDDAIPSVINSSANFLIGSLVASASNSSVGR